MRFEIPIYLSFLIWISGIEVSPTISSMKEPPTSLFYPASHVMDTGKQTRQKCRRCFGLVESFSNTTLLALGWPHQNGFARKTGFIWSSNLPCHEHRPYHCSNSWKND